MSVPEGSAAPAVRLSAIERRCGHVRALRGAELAVRAGSIHALVGENGAGKTTLMRILSGMLAPDAGRVEVDGRDVTGWSTREALASGVALVHQHFMLVPTLSVAENLVLGREPMRGGRLDRARAAAELAALCEESGLHVPRERPVAELSVGEAQRAEILKTLYRGARVLLLDEPTAVLSPPEVRELWKVLRRLRERGTTIVLVTHKLDEVFELADEVTVLRRGASVAHVRTRETTPEAIAHAMVGREIELDARPAARAAVRAGPGVFQVRGLCVRGARGERAVDEVSFEVAAGEILGIAGVEGNGQSELVEALAGLRTIERGEIRLGGRELAPLGVRARAAAGLAHVPEDRQRRALVLERSVAENLILGREAEFTRRGLLDRAAILAHARERIAAFDIRPADPALAVRALSGGNQQKLVLARELGRRSALLVAAQPTRGVDLGAVEFIQRQLLAARAAGQAVLLVSSDLRELLALADRIAVMFKGRLVAVLPRAEADEERLGAHMTGAGHEVRA